MKAEFHEGECEFSHLKRNRRVTKEGIFLTSEVDDGQLDYCLYWSRHEAAYNWKFAQDKKALQVSGRPWRLLDVATKKW